MQRRKPSLELGVGANNNCFLHCLALIMSHLAGGIHVGHFSSLSATTLSAIMLCASSK